MLRADESSDLSTLANLSRDAKSMEEKALEFEIVFIDHLMDLDAVGAISAQDLMASLRNVRELRQAAQKNKRELRHIVNRTLRGPE